MNKKKKNNKNYNDLLNKYNTLLSQKTDYEKKINDAIKSMNLDEKYQKFVNMEKPELIKV